MLLNSHEPLETRSPRGLQLVAALAVVAVLCLSALVRVEAETPPAAANPNVVEPKTEIKGESITYPCRVVEYGTDKPIAGATVTVERALLGDPRFERWKEIEKTTHTTDADGFYMVTIPPEQVAERYLYIQLDVNHPDYAAKEGFGYSFTMIRKNQLVGDPPFFSLTKLHPAKSVTGQLVTPEGQPAANVKITGYAYPGKERSFEDDLMGSFFESTTDDAGKFRLAVATPGQCAFWFLPDSYSPLGVAVPEERGDLGTIILKTGLQPKIKLLSADGKPAAGVEIQVDRQGSESPEVDAFNRTSIAVSGYSRVAKTDNDGIATVPAIDPGTYEVRIGERNSSKATSQFSGVFLVQSMNVSAADQTFEIRAVPTVTIRVQNMDSSGKPKRGFEFSVFGKLNGNWFWTQSDRPESGLHTAVVPKGLQDVTLDFIDNEHGAVRVRRTSGATPNAQRKLLLGTVNEDVAGIEVIRYVAPVLTVTIVDSEGNIVPDAKLTGLIRDPVSPIEGDQLNFEHQRDGRWRSRSLRPDVEVTLNVEKPGWKSEPKTISLKEGATEEIAVQLTQE